MKIFRNIPRYINGSNNRFVVAGKFKLIIHHNWTAYPPIHGENWYLQLEDRFEHEIDYSGWSEEAKRLSEFLHPQKIYFTKDEKSGMSIRHTVGSLPKTEVTYHGMWPEVRESHNGPITDNDLRSIYSWLNENGAKEIKDKTRDAIHTMQNDFWFFELLSKLFRF